MNDQQRPLPDTNEMNPVCGAPIDVWDQINKYGTYEVQDTTDTDNVFPTIGPMGGWKNCIDALENAEKKKKTEP